MADWVLVPCLTAFRRDLDRLAPDRDKGSDGSIGDAAHAGTSSDHNPDETGTVPIHDADRVNEVHAIDVDRDLRVPGLTMEMVVQHVVGRCADGDERRLRYVIYNRRIWSASNGWRERPYTGSNPHDKHAHFSSSYESTLEGSTSSWHLEAIPVALTDADKTWLKEQMKAAAVAAVRDEREALAAAVWNHTESNPARENWDGQGDEPDARIRVGGTQRMQEWREQARHAEVMAVLRPADDAR